MKIRLFVAATACLFTTWLASTYVFQCPAEGYLGLSVDENKSLRLDEDQVSEISASSMETTRQAAIQNLSAAAGH